MLMEPNDPTSSGSPLPSSELSAVILSRNEVDSLCFKAARGAGMSWGMAEEAGFAAGWLNERGLDGADATAAHLLAFAGKSWATVCPEVEAGKWQARGPGPLCPFALGAALSDFATIANNDVEAGGIEIGETSHPMLVLPFIASLSAATEKALVMSWPNGSVTVQPDGRIAGEIDKLEALQKAPLEIKRAETHEEAQSRPAGARIARETLETLNAYAMKTTVPPSERSRAGAGSEAGDND